MPTLHPTQKIMNLLNDYELNLYKEGFFPEVNYRQSPEDGFRVTSFNLFERQDVSRLLFRCLNFNLVRMGIQYGAFTRKSSASFLSGVKEVLKQMQPIDSSYVKRPAKLICPNLKLWGIGDKFRFRFGRLAQYEYMENIIDVSIDEENGYFAETGSAYIWEIAMIQDSSNLWRPFHLSEEEKADRKEIQGY
jgi:hypothetical protein